MIRHGTIEIDRKARTIRNGKRVQHFARSSSPNGVDQRFRLIQHMLLAGPKTQFQLFDMLYDGEAGGGPEYMEIIRIMINRLKPVFDDLRLELRKANGSGPKRYWLVARTAGGVMPGRPRSRT